MTAETRPNPAHATDGLLIPRPLAIELMHIAQLSPDAEICGLIASKNGDMVRQYSISNRAPEPDQRFEFDEAEHIAAQKKIRERGETLFAVYHSHPTAEAVPSDLDWNAVTSALDAEPPLLFIISLNIKGVLQTRAWQAKGDAFVERELRVIE